MRPIDPVQHQQRRQQIVEAALECFAEKGFHRTRTADIGRRAGMSPGHLFHYFDSKDAIFAEVVEQDRRDAAAHFAALHAREDRYGALLELADTVLALVVQRRYAALTLETAAEALRHPRLAAVFERDDALIKADLERLLGDAAQRGQIDPGLEPQALAIWLLALMEGALMRAALDPHFDLAGERATLRLLLEPLLRPRGGR